METPQFEKVDPRELQELNQNFNENPPVYDITDTDTGERYQQKGQDVTTAQIEAPEKAKTDSTEEEQQEEEKAPETPAYEAGEVDPTAKTKEEKVVTREIEETPSDQDTSVDSDEGQIVPAKEEEKTAVSQESNLPEGIDKLINFMNETGGTLEDYVHLNRDISKITDDDILIEYYKQIKGWDREEINDYLEDEFSFDAELDEPKEIRAKTRAKKTALRDARAFLKERKDKYYQELKASRASEETQNMKVAEQRFQKFKEGTNKVFGENFQGFDIDLGQNYGKVLFKVGNVDNVKQTQMNPSDALSEFMDSQGNITDFLGYHKSMYFARNGETVARRMYEQGRADAITERAKESKQVNMRGEAPTGSASNAPKRGVFERVQQTNNSPNRLTVNERYFPKSS